MDKEQLFQKRLPQQEVNIPGIGTITVRAISRYEQMLFSKKAAGDVPAFDRMQLAAAMVDPALTEDEARRWLEAAPAGELSIIIGIIGELSGTDKEVKELQKAAFKSLREDS